MTQRIQEVAALPVGGAGCQGASITTRGVRLVLSVDGPEDSGSAAWECMFTNFSAYRFRDEMHSRGFIPETYDRLCEIANSDWVNDMLRIRPRGKHFLELRHFAVMLSNVGYLEVLAEQVHVKSVNRAE